MCKDVRGASCPPLLRLREVVDGKDTIQTNPLEVDRILREAMGAIYRGNATEQRQQHMLDTFLAKFGQHCTQQPAMHVDPITADMLAEIIAAMPDSTPGLDGIRKGDLLLLSPYALEWLASFYEAIENGAAWPKLLKQARTAFLSKGEDDLDPKGVQRAVAPLCLLPHLGCGHLAADCSLDSDVAKRFAVCWDYCDARS